ncbi:MAG TPA: DUF1223 domain-containing protein [Burkholderiales bacterium]|nr:DUF1223 domain-containing protein [Burkholderiales bacterium]
MGILFSGQLMAGECKARSPEHTVALVELYTSEGCDSCPPADRWLSSLGAKGYAPDQVVPLALHVDYWDYIGWKDPYAQARFSSRQRKLAQLTRSAIVYTPQVLLQGHDFRGWGGGGFEAAVKQINARPARAAIELRLDTRGKGAFQVEVGADLKEASQRSEAALYVATYENKLSSKVQAGENRGKTLPHDFVVFEWVGPIEFKAGLKVSEKRALPLLPSANPAHSGVVAFVQNRANSEVLQALLLPACPD